MKQAMTEKRFRKHQPEFDLMRPSPKRAAILLGALTVFSLLAGVARAQLIVTLDMPKKDFVAHEKIEATVTVANRSGSDVILGGPNGSNWLTFEVLTQNTILSPLSTGMKLRPVVLKNGATMVKELNLGKEYPMGDYGTYKLVASVYYHPLDRYFSSAQKKIEVTKGRTMWKQGYGIAGSASAPATFREFSLMGFRRAEREDLYVGVKDQRSSRVLATYSLGRVLAVGDPRATVDSQNRLHVLHMGAPKVFVHSVVDADGDLVSQEIYKETDLNRPTMMVDNLGVVSVRGGQHIDPNAQAAARAAGQEPLERLASELPEGLPQ